MRNKFSKVRDICDFLTSPGNRVRRILESRFDGKSSVLVEVGREDVQDKINSYAPFTDLNYMLHRLSHGDMSVMTAKEPMYGDFSGLPRDPIEAVNMVHQSEQAFARLDPEVKQSYNNDWRRWFASLLSPASAIRDVASPADPSSADIQEV